MKILPTRSLKWLYVIGVRTNLIKAPDNSCQDPITRASLVILVTRSTACALKGDSWDWQKFSQEPVVSGCSDIALGSSSWDFWYTAWSSRSRVLAASLDSGSWSLSWEAATWINFSIPYAFIPSTPCWQKYYFQVCQQAKEHTDTAQVVESSATVHATIRVEFLSVNIYK